MTHSKPCDLSLIVYGENAPPINEAMTAENNKSILPKPTAT